MRVSEAIDSRISCRAFRDMPVPESTVVAILEAAKRAPSGGNLQPWRVDVLTGAPLAEFLGDHSREAAHAPAGEGTEYHVYPPNLHEPYRSRRFKCGEDLYATLGIPREDKAARIAALRAQLRVVRRAGRAVLLDRSAHGRGPVGRPRHVHAEHHAARARARPAHVPAGGVGDLVPDDRRVSAAAGRSHVLLRHGARLHGRERGGQQAAHRACAACRVCDLARLRASRT